MKTKRYYTIAGIRVSKRALKSTAALLGWTIVENRFVFRGKEFLGELK